MPTAKSGDVARLTTLIYKLLGRYNLNANGDIVSSKDAGNVTAASIQAAFSPDNVIVGNGVQRITVSTTPPISPQVGDIWIDTN